MPKASIPAQHEFDLSIEMIEEFQLTHARVDADSLGLLDFFADDDPGAWRLRARNFQYVSEVVLEACLQSAAARWLWGQPSLHRARQARFQYLKRWPVSAGLEVDLERAISRLLDRHPIEARRMRQLALAILDQRERAAANNRRYYPPPEWYKFQDHRLAQRVASSIRNVAIAPVTLSWFCAALRALREYHFDCNAVERFASMRHEIERQILAIERGLDARAALSDLHRFAMGDGVHEPRLISIVGRGGQEDQLRSLKRVLSALPSPIGRVDATAKERLFVYRMVSWTPSSMRSVGAASIGYLLETDGIEHQFSDRRVYGLCEQYKELNRVYWRSRFVRRSSRPT